MLYVNNIENENSSVQEVIQEVNSIEEKKVKKNSVFKKVPDILAIVIEIISCLIYLFNKRYKSATPNPIKILEPIHTIARAIGCCSKSTAPTGSLP